MIPTIMLLARRRAGYGRSDSRGRKKRQYWRCQDCRFWQGV